jgi:hypothetical protein
MRQLQQAVLLFCVTVLSPRANFARGDSPGALLQTARHLCHLVAGLTRRARASSTTAIESARSSLESVHWSRKRLSGSMA